MTFDEWWEDRRPLSHDISIKNMARFAWEAGSKSVPPEAAMTRDAERYRKLRAHYEAKGLSKGDELDTFLDERGPQLGEQRKA